MKSHLFFGFIIVLLLSGIKVQAQHIIVEPEYISLKKVFSEIEKQTSYTIAYNETGLDLNKKIYLSALTYDLDKLMALVLKDTKFRYSKRENHILIVPQSKNVFSHPAEKSFKGKVLSLEDSTSVSFATVRLLNSDNEVVIAGITNEKGEFSLITDGLVNRIQISFIGYQTEIRTIEEIRKDSEIFYLKTQVRQLEEALVSGSTTQFDVDRTQFIVTQKMIENTSSAIELLNKIPQLNVNLSERLINVGKEETVLLLINGIQHSQEYIKSISPERIIKIEIIQEPSGRFISENYSVIINFTLKKEYTGYDLNIGNGMTVNTTGTNGNDWLTRIQPEINFTFTKNKLNLYVYYNHEKNQLNLSHYRQTKYGENEMTKISKSENISLNNPNNSYHNQVNRWVTGVNYHIHPQHVFSLQGDYTLTRAASENTYQFNRSPVPDPFKFYHDTTVTRLKDKNYILSAFYKGFVNERFQLYGDFSYNNYSDRVDNYYTHETLIEKQNPFNEKKNQLSTNMEGNFRISPSYFIITGYSNNWREYTSNSTRGEQYIDFKESRNNLFFYLVSHFTEAIQTKIGGNFESINSRSINNKNTQWSLQPYFLINYNLNKRINLNVSYTTNTDNPTLYQLSAMPLILDSVLNQKGNPELKTSVNHIFSTRFSYGNHFFFKTEFKHSPKGIAETFEQNDDNRFDYHIFLTYDNAKIHEYSMQLDMNQPITNSISWQGSVLYYYDKMKYKEITNTLDGWLLKSQFDYYNNQNQLGFQLGYYRNMNKNIIWQGYQMSNIDKWELTVKKFIWEKKVVLTLSYIPPLDWGIRNKLTKKIDSSFFAENSYTNMKAYRNNLFLKIEFRLNNRKVTPTKVLQSNDYNIPDRRRLDLLQND